MEWNMFYPDILHFYSDLEGKVWIYNSWIPGVLWQNVVAQEKQASKSNSWTLAWPCFISVPKGLMHT